MTTDPLTLSRIQFGFTITFHIIFPAMSIGLAGFLVLTEGLWLRTRDPLYLRIYRFWQTLFAMGFGVGVVTGIVLSFQFGTNFARFAQMAGPVIGPMIGLEVLSSFFLEAGFLGIMLFGMGRVGPRLHFFATCMVALGTMISSTWILSANSWMQTPDGFALVDGRFVATDWWRVVFNPSFLVRLPHMLLAAWITGAFLVSGVAAYYLLRGRHLDFARRTFSIGLGLASVLIAVQLFLGDIVASTMAAHQPSKFNAIEGHWEQTPSAPYLLFITPDQAGQRNRAEFGIPWLGSVLITHSFTGTVNGLKQTPVAEQPPMAPVFYGFRLMFLLGLTMFAAACIHVWLRLRGRLFTTRWFQRFVLLLTPAGFLATIGGWYTAEMGRQPYVVYGQLRTADALSPVAPQAVLTSLTLFVLAYTVFGASFLYLVLRVIRRGPADDATATAAAPFSGSLKRALMSRRGDPATPPAPGLPPAGPVPPAPLPAE